jgi:hypothetical protein
MYLPFSYLLPFTQAEEPLTKKRVFARKHRLQINYLCKTIAGKKTFEVERITSSMLSEGQSLNF